MGLVLSDGAAIAGFYDLVRVNGDALPVSVQVTPALANGAPRYRIQAGELLLHPSGTFGLELTAVEDSGREGNYGRVFVAGGRWQFRPEGLEDACGRLVMVSPKGNATGASVTALSLVYQASLPGIAAVESDLNWTYARRALRPPVGNRCQVGSEPTKGIGCSGIRSTAVPGWERTGSSPDSTNWSG